MNNIYAWTVYITHGPFQSTKTTDIYILIQKIRIEITEQLNKFEFHKTKKEAIDSAIKYLNSFKDT